MRNILLHVLRLIYPNNCLICNESLAVGEEHLCLSCLYKLPKTNYHLQPNNPIEKRFWGKVHLQHASSYLQFEKGGSVQVLLHHIKYKGGTDLAVFMGKQIGYALNESSFYTDVDFVVPVPLHKNRFKKRGYNQSELLVNGIAEAMGKTVDANTLIRKLENPTQTKKTVYERWENTHGIFDVQNLSVFENKHVLLVDDVLTTGSTLEACVVAIEQCSGVKISVVTLAQA